MKFYKCLIALGSALVIQNAQASSTWVIEYAYDGTAVSEIQDATGQNLAIGDTVEATFNATGGYWRSGGEIWPLIEIVEPGTRTGDAIYSLFAAGTQVYTHTSAGQITSDTYIIDPLTLPLGLDFDKLTVSYLLQGSTSEFNTLGDDFVDYADLVHDSAIFISGELQPSTVPLPAALPLMLSGLGVLGFIARRRKNTAV
jgi:hypothetical protein